MERLIRQLMEANFSGQQQTGAAGSQQAHARGPAEGPRRKEAPVPEQGPALASGGEIARVQETRAGPLGRPPGGGRVNEAGRGQHRQSTEGGVVIDGGDRARSRTEPGTSASPSASPAASGTTDALEREASPSPAGSGSGSAPRGARADWRMAPGGSGGGGGGGCPSAAPEEAAATGPEDRQQPAETTTVRHRFRGDMRQFVMIHRKTD